MDQGPSCFDLLIFDFFDVVFAAVLAPNERRGKITMERSSPATLFQESNCTFVTAMLPMDAWGIPCLFIVAPESATFLMCRVAPWSPHQLGLDDFVYTLGSGLPSLMAKQLLDWPQCRCNHQRARGTGLFEPWCVARREGRRVWSRIRKNQMWIMRQRSRERLRGRHRSVWGGRKGWLSRQRQRWESASIEAENLFVLTLYPERNGRKDILLDLPEVIYVFDHIPSSWYRKSMVPCYCLIRKHWPFPASSLTSSET